ncbi:hypothetical protein AJ78_05221 [Emergomyces pasteurianus Ep9510]|uniref:RING-type E3 ubiquitin transferase n=1 Tax=Emergomyces pasteurianus Ep9510 TaxID=1447872 RepID=A0A1J9QEQ5_9EURO|nr:hypothetical protein AJ78_05221 [Emergomyces pasteurianus Ep9510]
MAQDVDLQQEILRKTLDEVADSQSDNINPCVICLERITEAATAQPCKHASFDFLCLLSWLQQRPACPLCQATVTSVKYEPVSRSVSGPTVYHVPPPPQPASQQDPTATASLGSAIGGGYPRPRRFPHRPPLRRAQQQPLGPDDPISRRRHIYRHQLYSRRVGTNRLSQYRELTPQHFNQDADLFSRARKWIRRELQVFAFLNPTTTTARTATTTASNVDTGDTTAAATTSVSGHKASNNAEFLLEYIIAILRTVDMKGSSGQAEELLQEFIGRDHARLFLHELQAWLRSPYTSLADWDRAVQYDDFDGRDDRHNEQGSQPPTGTEMEMGNFGGRRAANIISPSSSTTTTINGRHRGRSWPGRRISKPMRSAGVRFDSAARYDTVSRARRIQRARDRYQPD